MRQPIRENSLPCGFIFVADVPKKKNQQIWSEQIGPKTTHGREGKSLSNFALYYRQKAMKKKMRIVNRNKLISIAWKCSTIETIIYVFILQRLRTENRLTKSRLSQAGLMKIDLEFDLTKTFLFTKLISCLSIIFGVASSLSNSSHIYWKFEP